MTFERAGPYQYQAAIAALHARRGALKTPMETNRGALSRIAGAPANAGCCAQCRRGLGDGGAKLDEGLARIDALEESGELSRYHLLHAARDLHRRAGRIDEARKAYERALTLVHKCGRNGPLERRVNELNSR